MTTICKEIQDYIDIVRSGEVAVCREQILACNLIEYVLENEDVYIDTEQLQKYLSFQKYFPYKLLPWEIFCFAIHNTLYKSNGQLRFPVLVILVGRGAGKNGYLAFEDFALVTPVNNVMHYDIDIFATAEDQARATFDDIYDILDSNENVFKGKFSWNKEVIENIKTKSKIKFRTSNPKSKDGGRPGKIDFDEYHAYENHKLIDVAVTGLGKKKHPRRTIITTQGDVRDGPLDKGLKKWIQILNREVDDNGTFPFICRLDSDEEIENPKMWDKANPSLRYFPDLQQEIEMEFADYLEDPISNQAFAVKRMNRPKDDMDLHITKWEKVEAATREIPDMTGWDCICGIDFASFSDFASVVLLFKKGEQRYIISHSWCCRNSSDYKRINAPMEEWKNAGLLTIVDTVEIFPEFLTEWIYEAAKKYNILKIFLDHFRYALIKKALDDIGFKETKDRKTSKIIRIRPSDKYMVAPKVLSIFNRELLAWGKNNPLFRWYVWNTKIVRKNGNIEFEKIEERSRKNDGFMAYIAALCGEDLIIERIRPRQRMATIC